VPVSYCDFLRVQNSATAHLICTLSADSIGDMKTPLTVLSFSAALGLSSAHRLTALDLSRKITTKQAAELNGVSEDFFKRNYRHLIRQIGPRRNAVTLGDAINLPPAPPAA
jgi:hypothetical protein